MNRYIRCLLAAMLAAGLSVGCSLEETVTSNSTRKTYYKDVMQIRTGLNGCYNPIRSIFSGSSFFEMTECAADIMRLDISTQYNATCDISPSRPGVASTVWQYGYNGVMRCNEMADIIAGTLEKGYVTAEEAEPLMAEAKVLRAFFYYLLTSTFGDVPFYTEAVTEENRARIARLPRMSADSTRNFLIDELMEELMPESEGGKEALPLMRTYGQSTEYRAGAALGLMVAGKFCMWNERWEDAISILSVLESPSMYGSYKDNPESFGAAYPLTDIPFSQKYTKESIFELGNSVEPYGLQNNGTLAVFCMPTRGYTDADSKDDKEEESIEEGATDVVTDIYCGIGVPELGKYARTYTSIRPTAYYYTQLMRYASSDLRSGEYSNGAKAARGGSGNLAWRWEGYAPEDTVRAEKSVRWFKAGTNTSTNLSATTCPWLGNKFWCFDMYNNKDSNNYKIFRYAGALLNLSEAYLMGRGDMQTACDYLNIIRVRAGLEKLTPASVGGSPEALMEEIRQECARELFGEYQRKFDLVRWGIWYERTLMYNDCKYIKDYIRPHHEYWPIPAEQVTYSSGALDNDAYKE